MLTIHEAWKTWQVTFPEEAARIRNRFATKAVEHGFAKAERYLITAIAERLNVGWQEVATAIKQRN